MGDNRALKGGGGTSEYRLTFNFNVVPDSRGFTKNIEKLLLRVCSQCGSIAVSLHKKPQSIFPH